MTTTRIVPDSVWLQLDPQAGRLSLRERRTVIASIIALVVVAALTVFALISGAFVPRIHGDMRTARSTPAKHELDLRVRVSNAGWIRERVSAVTIASPSYRVVSARPASFTLAHGEALTVQMRIDVRSCSATLEDDVLPVAVVVHRWWGHQTDVLFTHHGSSGFSGIARTACRGS